MIQNYGYLATASSPLSKVNVNNRHLPVTETLQQFFHATVQGTLVWLHRQERQAQDIADVFTAQLKGIELQLSAIKAKQKTEYLIPDSVLKWAVGIEWLDDKAGKGHSRKKRTLDGRQLNLPPTGSMPRNLSAASDNLLGYLFKAVYEQLMTLKGDWLTQLQAFVQQTHEGLLKTTKTVVRSDDQYGLPGGTMLQVGQGVHRLEVFTSGLGMPNITLYTPDSIPRKLSTQQTRHPMVKALLHRLTS